MVPKKQSIDRYRDTFSPSYILISTLFRILPSLRFPFPPLSLSPSLLDI